MTLPRLPERTAALIAAREQRKAELTEALRIEQGNITRAAQFLQLSRQRVTVLVREEGLGEYARKLRRAAGIRGEKATGRPLG